MKIKALLSQRIESAFEALGLQGQAMLQAASRPEFGDYQANGVMAAAKRSGQNPKEVAAQVIAQLDLKGIAKDISIAGPGFINITLAEEFLATICNTQPSKTENRKPADSSSGLFWAKPRQRNAHWTYPQHHHWRLYCQSVRSPRT